MTLPPRTPVLVGSGVATQRLDDPLEAVDAVGLMRRALDAAAADAGAAGPALLDRVDEILVPEGIWPSRDPGRHVLAGRSPAARSVLVAVGVLQQRAFTRAATAIRDGEARVVVVCGGEAKWRSRRAERLGVAIEETRDADGQRADEVLAPVGPILHDLEIERGLAAPTHQYAVVESAARHDSGRSVTEHARHLAGLVAGLSEIAAANPHAWTREPMTEDEVLAAPLVAEPYTRPCCAQWNVDQAAAFLLCAAEEADAAGIARDRWVFPVAAAESDLMVPLVARAGLHRSPATAEVGHALARRGGRPLADVELVELYSCFPAALEVQRRELGLGDRDAAGLSVAGGMYFAGGPLNSFTLQALAVLVERLRAAPESTALLTSVSGVITKVGGGLWSGRPAASGFVAEDVTAAATEATATRSVDARHRGPVTVAGYTIGHHGGVAVEAVVVGDTPEGVRTIAASADPATLAGLAGDERVGTRVVVDHGRLLDLA